MDLRSFIGSDDQPAWTVESVKEDIAKIEIRCAKTIEELFELDAEFRELLSNQSGSPSAVERTRRAMKLRMRYQKFRAKWSPLIEHVRTLHALVTLIDRLPDDIDPEAPIDETDVIEPGPDTDDLSANDIERVVRHSSTADIEATLERLDVDTDPFRDLLIADLSDDVDVEPSEIASAVLDDDSTDDVQELMEGLLNSELDRGVHLWTVYADLDGPDIDL
jgi:hypothetical protein